MIREIELKKIFQLYLESHGFETGLKKTHRGYKADASSSSLSFELFEKTKTIIIEERFTSMGDYQYKAETRTSFFEIICSEGNIVIFDAKNHKSVFKLVSDKDILRIASAERQREVSALQDANTPSRLQKPEDKKPLDTLF